MSYAVIHGDDQSVTLCKTARECLELVMLLEARAEPGIRIVDRIGAEIRLGQLEKLQRREVERINAPAAAASLALSPADSRERLARSRSARCRTTVAAFLVALTALGLFIHAVNDHRDKHGGAPRAVGTHDAKEQVITRPLPSRQGPEAAGQASSAQSVKSEGPAASDRAPRPRTYRIVAGDTLSRIAKKIYHDPARWRDIATANSRLVPNRLPPGEVIILPDSASLAMPK